MSYSNAKVEATIAIFEKKATATRLFTIEHDAASGWVAREQHDLAIHTSMIRDWPCGMKAGSRSR